MKLIVAKFGGSAIGAYGEGIPVIVKRISDLMQDAKIVCVFSAPLSIQDDKKRSITDIMLSLGKKAGEGQPYTIQKVKETYEKILELANPEKRDQCKKIIDDHLKLVQKALEDTKNSKEFSGETRSNALAFSGEVLMSHVMNHILCGHKIKSAAVPFDLWPIITDNNIESTNFLYSESVQHSEHLEELVEQNDVVCMGGFIGKTTDGITTTYERGGSDRTAADLGILLSKKYDTEIDFEKDSAVVSADPKIVKENLTAVNQLSYNEARQAGMFGMKILDPIAIKEILENGVDMPIIVTNMKDPAKTTTIKRKIDSSNGHPIKIVTGKKNCAIFRIETDSASRLLASLDTERRYSEFVILSPYTKDGTEFTRILFLDGDYVKSNEKYLLGFDSLATITYNRGVVTPIGDEMWKMQQLASKTSSKIGDIGLNILNMDAQEETSRIIIVVEDAADNISNAVRAVHSEKEKFA